MVDISHMPNLNGGIHRLDALFRDIAFLVARFFQVIWTLLWPLISTRADLNRIICYVCRHLKAQLDTLATSRATARYRSTRSSLLFLFNAILMSGLWYCSSTQNAVRTTARVSDDLDPRTTFCRALSV